jgi:hypothetical protein
MLLVLSSRLADPPPRLVFSGLAGLAIFDVGHQLVVSSLESYGFIRRNRTQSGAGGVHLGGSQSFQVDAKCNVMNRF